MEPSSIGVTLLKKLKQYSQLTKDQLDAINWLECHPTGALWADVGTGKTVAALTAAKRLIDRFDVRRILVVGPRLIAERVWSTEVEEWEHLRGLRVSRIVGSAAQRNKALAVDADIYTVSRDNVCWLESLFIDVAAKRQTKRWPFDLVILDESQSFKSNSAKRFKSIRRLRRLFGRCWLLSGSPMPNGYQDLWTQVYLVDGGKRLGLTYTAFLDKYFRKEVNDGIPTFDIRPEAPAQIEDAVRDIFCVMRDAQPPAPTNFIKVRLSKEALAAYRKMARSSVLALGEGEITAVSAGVLFNKLCQMANGACYSADRRWHVLHSHKLDYLLELLESLPRPVLIGYSFQHDIERMQAALAKAKVPGVAVIRTTQSLDAWRRGEVQVGILHPASAGHGLNDLQNAAAIVWYGLTSNLEHYQQLNGRVLGGHRRAGRTICVHHLSAEGTIDEELRGMIESKDLTQSNAQVKIAEQMRRDLCPSAPEPTKYSPAESKIPVNRCPTDPTMPSIK